jgi:thiamine biosynthesis lipoprotein
MPREQSGRAFGTTWHLKTSQGLLHEKAVELQSQLDGWEAQISHWKPDSAVSRFNASTGTEWQNMPVEVIELVRLAEKIAHDTDGALDITLAPLIDLWGFGSTGPRTSPPDAAEIEKARVTCGWHLLDIRDQPPALRKKHPHTQINLSSVAEGWALERLAQFLEASGAHDFLLELGGEVLARGHSADGKPWLVGVQAPDAPVGESMQALRLADASLCTSGTYRQRFEHDEQSYAHVLDPRTGSSVEHAPRSVSVMHASAAMADGYATALLVLGPIRGREIAARLGLNVLWVE